MAVFAVADVMFEALLLEGGMGVWGAATRSWWPPIVHTDDWLQWMALADQWFSRAWIFDVC